MAFVEDFAAFFSTAEFATAATVGGVASAASRPAAIAATLPAALSVCAQY